MSGGAGPAKGPRGPRLSRRQLLGAGGLGVGVAFGAGGLALGRELEGRANASEGQGQAQVVPFYGAHQAGIATLTQERLHFAAFDLDPSARRGDLRELLRAWTAAAARLCAGQAAGADPGDPAAPPVDTGEALGLPASRLTVTFGFGTSLFGGPGADRFGLASRRPAALADLPPFPREQLDPARSGGDLAVQVCADDAQVAFHAVRNLTRIARGVALLRWDQLGFGRAASTSQAQQTPRNLMGMKDHQGPTNRNLMGMKDGTNNLRVEDAAALDQHVWVGTGDQPAWMRGGTYLVARRIRMLLEVWDRSSLDDQERTIGRVKATGAPLGSRNELDPVDLAAKRPDGKPVIPADAHIRLAAPASNGGAKLLRRGYSFSDGIDQLGQFDAGLFFLAFQRDPRRQFVPIQRRLAAADHLNEYVHHTGSALFAVPPGIAPGGYIGETLLEA
jgi:deferrochelatase/peroxidase EfeB